MLRVAPIAFIPLTMLVAPGPLRASDSPYFMGLGGSAEGFSSGGAFAISADGNVVAGSAATDTGSGLFLWSRSTGVVFLPPAPTGHDQGLPSLSGDGRVVATSFHDNTEPLVLAQRWTQVGGWQALGDIPDGQSQSYAEGVSGDGSTIIGFANTSEAVRAFRWTAATGMTPLSPEPPGVVGEWAFAISTDGSAIVGQQYYESPGLLIPQAFRWTEQTGMVALGDLPGGAEESLARAVSADGATVVGDSHTYGNVTEAFRWTSEDGMVGLGNLPGGQVLSLATAVSGDGSVVVGVSGSSRISEAFIWDETHGMRSLQDVLAMDYHLDLTGWLLDEVRGISADGLTFAGSGTDPEGQAEAWVAHIPEPAAMVLFMMGLGALSRGRLSYSRRASCAAARVASSASSSWASETNHAS